MGLFNEKVTFVLGLAYLLTSSGQGRKERETYQSEGIE